MEHFSKKYQKWFGCYESNRHPRSLNLFRVKDFYYRPDKDMLIHKDIVDDYIDKCSKISKRHKKDAYCKKNNIEIKD
jgi:hypothetical protein